MIPHTNSSVAESGELDYRTKFHTLKRKLKSLVYEHELLTEELEKSQKKLLRVSRDRSFLLDRLLQYERVAESSSDSEATDLSESETDKSCKKKSIGSGNVLASAGSHEETLTSNVKLEPSSKPSSSDIPKKKKASKKQKLNPPVDRTTEPALSLEDIEKHLASRPKVMAIEKATTSMPFEIFSNESCALDSEGTSDTEMDMDLIIDMK